MCQLGVGGWTLTKTEDHEYVNLHTADTTNHKVPNNDDLGSQAVGGRERGELFESNQLRRQVPQRVPAKLKQQRQ